MEKFRDWWCYHYKHIYLIGGCILVVFLLLGIGIWKFCFKEEESDIRQATLVLEKKEEKEEVIEIVDKIVVDIKGAVNSPGIYYVDSNSRVSDVISLAGGVLEHADTSVINLGRKVFDEMVIIIYTKDAVNNFVKVKEEEKEKQEACVIVEEKIINNACVCDDDIDSSGSNTSNDVTDKIEVEDSSNNSNDNNSEGVGLVNINKASLDELMTLSGIGESKAKLIIEYRNSNGSFKDVSELKNIKGIGDSIFDKIKDHITL